MSGKFEPKTPVQLNPPKSDPIPVDELAKANGTCISPAYQLRRGRVLRCSNEKRTPNLPYFLTLSIGIDGAKCYVAIKAGVPSMLVLNVRDSESDHPQGKVYDVTGNKVYQPGGSYHGKL